MSTNPPADLPLVGDIIVEGAPSEPILDPEIQKLLDEQEAPPAP